MLHYVVPVVDLSGRAKSRECVLGGGGSKKCNERGQVVRRSLQHYNIDGIL